MRQRSAPTSGRLDALLHGGGGLDEGRRRRLRDRAATLRRRLGAVAARRDRRARRAWRRRRPTPTRVRCCSPGSPIGWPNAAAMAIPATGSATAAGCAWPSATR
ncbi:MAG: hypothetical protein R2755_20155 [Acidimicrobiales bacterium]